MEKLLITLYFNNLESIEQIYNKKYSHISLEEFYELLCKNIFETNCSTILKEIDFESNRKLINSKTIPQFSQFSHGSFELIKILSSVDFLEFNYISLGKIFLENNKNDGAYRKYGENHVKLASLLGYINFSKAFNFKINSYGIFVNELEINFRENINRKNILRIPIVSHILKEASFKEVSIYEVLKKSSDLSESTIKRRASSIKTLLKEVQKLNDISIAEVIGRIYEL